MSEDNCIKFAQNIKRYRELKKYSKGRMSELVGCDVSYIGKIERSEKYPNLKMIFKIAEALEIPARCLFEFD